MKKKYQMTGCAKFFVVILLLAPLAYIGASYYNGQDGIENLKSLLGIGTQTSEPTVRSQDDDAEIELSNALKDVKYFEGEVERLRKELEACQEARQQ
ncbi:MAG: hypothetical protein HKN87_05035 [Saprospiraceae bacterium]|nr:hypothetical protein [Saprospiraceae bacterium]